MPHRINSLLCALLCLCLTAESAHAQSSIPRTATGGVRPAPKKSTIPSEAPATSLPRIAREPVGRAAVDAESAESAAPAAQKPAVRPRQGVLQGPAPKQPAAAGPAPLVDVALPEGMEALLDDWEQKTKDINSLSCPITRYEFDNIFAKETRSIGMIYFENPDRGRIDFEPAGEELLTIPSGRQDKKAKPFKVIPGVSSKWICTGKTIYILDNVSKSYDRVQIPPQMQGQNITRSPLPFIFGMKAQDAKDRFALRYGKFHNPTGKLVDKNGKAMRKVLHIVANPFDPNVAREYTQAEIVLDPATFLPMNLRTIDPSGNKETVYSFDQSKLKVGEGFGLKAPFKDPTLIGWQLMHDVKAEPDKASAKQVQEVDRKIAVPR